MQNGSLILDLIFLPLNVMKIFRSSQIEINFFFNSGSY